jgi:hypothetical protein
MMKINKPRHNKCDLCHKVKHLKQMLTNVTFERDVLKGQLTKVNNEFAAVLRVVADYMKKE